MTALVPLGHWRSVGSERHWVPDLVAIALRRDRLTRPVRADAVEREAQIASARRAGEVVWEFAEAAE